MVPVHPRAVSGPIADEVREVICVARGSDLGTGIAFAVFFSSSGIESLRIGLNRAYRVPGYPFVPLVFVLVATWFVVNTLITNPADSMVGLVLLALGLPLYLYWKKQPPVVEQG